MVYFTKEIYKKKNEWAAKRMAENAKNKNLSEDQHEALAEICCMRHKTHCNSEDYIISTESKYDEINRFYPTEWGDGCELLRLIEENNLPKIKIDMIKYDSVYDDNDSLLEWYEQYANIDMDKDWRESPLYDDYKTVEDYFDGEYHNLAFGAAKQQCMDCIDKLDQQVRNYLSYIDYLYNSDYAPARGDITEYKIPDMLN